MLKTYKIVITEYRGHDCDGHPMPYLIAAQTKEEARQFIINHLRLEEWQLQDVGLAEEFVIPKTSSRAKKPRLISLSWKKQAKHQLHLVK